MQIDFPQKPELKNIIQYYWHLRADNVSGDESILVFPEPCFEILLNCTGKIQVNYKDKTEQYSAFFSPVRQDYFHVRAIGNPDYFAVRFYPHAVSQLFSIPLHEIHNVHSLDCLPASIQTLLRLISTIEDQTERINVFEEQLLQILSTNEMKQNDQFERIISEILNSQGTRSVDELARKFYLHPRSLERLFLEKTGANPKYFSRVVRFNSFYEKIAIPGIRRLSQYALRFGFTDQSHLTRDCKYFTGTTPGKLLKSFE